MVWTTIIGVDSVSRGLEGGGLRIVDCRFSLADPESGRAEHEKQHIPGAVYAHLDEDLSAPITSKTGRHPLPDPQHLATRLASWGIDRETQIVAYDDSGGPFAARFWWLARWLGHAAVAVLDGGFSAWIQAGHPTVSGHQRFDRVDPVTPQPLVHMEASATEIEANLTQEQLVVLDARAPDRYAGKVEPIDAVAGHVPGAVSHHFKQNLDGEGRFLDPESLRQRLSSVIGDHPPQGVVHMCGSGVTACHNLLAMEVAGLHGARLYPGSWSEWIRDPSRPVSKLEHDEGRRK